MALSVEVPSKPKSVGTLSNNDIIFGKPIPAIDRLKIVSDIEFEDVIRKWIWGYLIKAKTYLNCKKCSGAGDKGRDVIAIVDEEKNIWDNYQCKHYDHPLAPSDIWIEIGKLCYYTYTNEYSIPKKYFFVSPLGIGAKLNGLFENPEKLKKEFLDNWDQQCKNKISKNTVINLTNDLKEFINAIDFTIFSGYDPQRLIDELKTTEYFSTRFGGGLIKPRQQTSVPREIDKKEMVYTTQLLEAYSEHKKSNIPDLSTLDKFAELREHFIRQRESYYYADALRQFSRDNLPPEVDYFEDLKSEVYIGVVDIYSRAFTDGYERLLATVIQAKTIQINGNALTNYIRQNDREGICHHLANDNKLIWVKK